MKKIRFEAVVRSKASAIQMASINNVKLVPLIGKKVKVTITVIEEAKPHEEQPKAVETWFKWD